MPGIVLPGRGIECLLARHCLHFDMIFHVVPVGDSNTMEARIDFPFERVAHGGGGVGWIPRNVAHSFDGLDRDWETCRNGHLPAHRLAMHDASALDLTGASGSRLDLQP